MKRDKPDSEKSNQLRELVDPPSKDVEDKYLVIPETATLLEAIWRLNRCTTGFTVFCENASNQITGVISRGDILRFIEKHPDWTPEDASFSVRDAMTPHRSGAGPRIMLFVRIEGERSWYDQITSIREQNWEYWNR